MKMPPSIQITVDMITSIAISDDSRWLVVAIRYADSNGTLSNVWKLRVRSERS